MGLGLSGVLHREAELLATNLTKDLADVGVVHVGERLQDLPPLVFGPNHEGIHRPLDVWLVAVSAASLPKHSRFTDVVPYETKSGCPVI